MDSNRRRQEESDGDNEKADVDVANKVTDENSVGPFLKDFAVGSIDNAKTNADKDVEAYIRRVDGLDSQGKWVDTACSSIDLASNDPLINYVDFKRKKKKKNRINKDIGVELDPNVDENENVNPNVDENENVKGVSGGRSITLSWNEYNQQRTNHQEEVCQVQSQKSLEKKTVPNKAVEVLSSSQPSLGTQNRRSLLFKNARKMLDVGSMLGIEIRGGRKYNLKRLVEMEEQEIAEREKALKKYPELEDCEDFDKDDEASISLEF